MTIIVVIKNQLDDIQIKLSQTPVIIGRSSSCNVKVNDGQTSSKHVSLHLSSSWKILIRDLGSSNGTFLNESIIEEANLMLGDILRIGDTTLFISKNDLSPVEIKRYTNSDEKTQVRYLSIKQDKIIRPSEVINNLKKQELDNANIEVASPKKQVSKNKLDLKLDVVKKDIRHGKIIKRVIKKKSIFSKLFSFFKN